MILVIMVRKLCSKDWYCQSRKTLILGLQHTEIKVNILISYSLYGVASFVDQGKLLHGIRVIFQDWKTAIPEGTLRILHALRPGDGESIFEGHFIFLVGISCLLMNAHENKHEQSS
jgi:hypothetical protein